MLFPIWLLRFWRPFTHQICYLTLISLGDLLSDETTWYQRKQPQRRGRRKRHLKHLNSCCFKLHRSYFSSFNFSKINVGEYCFGVKFGRTVSKFRRKRKLLFCGFVLHKNVISGSFKSCRETSRQRNVQKSVMHALVSVVSVVAQAP